MSFRKLRDLIASRLMLIATIFSASLVLWIIFGLVWKSKTILALKPLGDLILSSAWHPLSGEFGLSTFIISTVYVTVIAMVIAVPLCLLTSIYLAEFASKRVRAVMKPMIDLLAGIPSVVFGLFGVLLIVPFSSSLGSAFGVNTTGYNLLSGGIVLAIMVFPVIISISEEVIRTVPRGIWEASLALGATRWQAAKLVVGRAALPGIFAAIVLGFGRAFGETMAVLMVIGNVVKTPVSIFDPAYPLPALIANNYGEMMSVPQYESALMFAALLLLAIVFITSVGARLILVRMERRNGI